MKPLFHCTIDYYPGSPHLNLLYDGFEKLRKAGMISLSVNRKAGGFDTKGLFSVLIDNKYEVIYDVQDGFNWIKGKIEDNLAHFEKNIKADFYFKRSFSKRLLDHRLANCMVYPLGFNYTFLPEGKYPVNQPFIETVKDKIKAVIEKTPGLSKLYHTKKYFYHYDFEAYPIPDKQNKILFLVRLWDPNDVTLEHLKAERESINQNRINCIKACREEFGERFTGGLQMNSFAMKHAKELIAPDALTGKENYLNLTKQHNICIATTGLHDSIGWKFGEYVAASRAIVTEPLKYELPGNFEEQSNYFVFRNEDDLVNGINYLLKEKDALFEMMNNNFQYYNNYLRSDKLVLNTLLIIYQNIE